MTNFVNFCLGPLSTVIIGSDQKQHLMPTHHYVAGNSGSITLNGSDGSKSVILQNNNQGGPSTIVVLRQGNLFPLYFYFGSFLITLRL